MGNEFKSLPIHKYIKNALKPEKMKLEEKEEYDLMEKCQKICYREEEIIFKDNLNYIIQLSNQEIFDILFSIFGREKQKHEIITFDDMKYLYFSFKSENSKVKATLISFLLFGNKDSLSIEEINKNIFKIFNKDINILQPKIIGILGELDSVNTKKNNKNTKKKKNYNEYHLEDLIKRLEKEDIFKDFHFMQKILGSTEYKFNSAKNVNGNLNYICDCTEKMESQKQEDNFDSMKNCYALMTSKSYNVLYMETLNYYLNQYKIHKCIANLVIDYIQNNTQKEYCNFNDLKYIFSNLNYSLSLNDKKKFLFKMISSLNNKDKEDNKLTLTYNQIKKYLDIDINEKSNKNINSINDDKSDLYTEEDFMKNNKFDEMINKLKPHLENFGLLPYLLFQAKTDDKNIKRKIIKEILRNENIDSHEKYLEIKFSECDSFYAIDINFWKQLMNDNEEPPEYLNNSNIAEKIELVTEEDKLEEKIRILKRKIAQENKIKYKKDKKDKDGEKKESKKEKDDDDKKKKEK